MTLKNEDTLDEIDWQILQELTKDGRLSLSELGRRVHLSQPAVAERVRRLEESGVIRGYHAEVNAVQIGLPITAFIRLTSTPAQSERFMTFVHNLPEIIECYRITGNDCFVLKVVVSSMPHLETLINQLTPYGTPSTSIVLSSVLTRHTYWHPNGRTVS